jgi:outer membrane immunogenic protein
MKQPGTGEIEMKKFLLATVALAALGTATSASAADLAARPYTKAPPIIVAVYDWTGFYIGANGGWGTQRRCGTDVTFAPFAALGCHDADGGVAGGQIGYRWQSAGWVFGLEAQGDWADLKGSNVSQVFAPQTLQSRMNAFGLFTGQVGYAWNNTLLYVKGGAAVTSNNYRDIATVGGATLASAGDSTRWGGTVGVGLEYGFTPNWTFGVEYDHLFIGSQNYNLTTPAGLFFGTARVSGDADIVTARINYKWGGPVIAKY